MKAKAVTRRPLPEKPTYSICTMVTRPKQYEEMQETFIRNGFGLEDTQYLVADNSSGNQLDGYAAINVFLQEASEPYIILCHQDILLLQDGRQRMDEVIAELNRTRPLWALTGNAGAKADGEFAVHISDPKHSDLTEGGPFPTKVVTLDENFVVVRRDRNLATSGDLTGFHFYATDLCMVAAFLGYEAYVCDFHLKHLSTGNFDATYWALRRAYASKHARLQRHRWLPTPTGQPIYLSHSRSRTFLAKVLRRLKLSKLKQ